MSDTFEVNKEIEITPMMQLVDLNGTKVNFQSEFTVSSDSNKIGIAIVSQEQLDNGDIRFEPMEEGGTYSRRITYQKNSHQNHFIALKKLDKDETPVVARVIVRLKELPLVKEEPQQTLPRDRAFEEQPKMRNDIQKKLSSLSKREDYSQSPDSQNDHNDYNDYNDYNDHNDQNAHNAHNAHNGPLNINNKNISNNVSNNSNISIGQRGNNGNNTKPEMTFSDRLRYDPYYLVGVVSIVLFVAILFYKFNLAKAR
jgi:hypothetical protein